LTDTTKLDPYGGWVAVQDEATGFFRTAELSGRWWLITPEGHPFISLGVNHMDVSALRYSDNICIYRERYNADEQTYIHQGVAAWLKEWAFNTVGWPQEVFVAGQQHSKPWQHTQYQWTGMPYCHLLPFTQFEIWNKQARVTDVFGADFEQWCDWIARDFCLQAAADPFLIGYFFSDVFAWGGHKTSLLLDDFLNTRAKGECGELGPYAAQYYKVICNAIRRYDPNHLLLGDRFDGNSGIPDVVLHEACKHIDVVCAQYFGPWELMQADFARWHKMSGKPCMNVDCSYYTAPCFPVDLPSVTCPHNQDMPGYPAKNHTERGGLYKKNLGAAFKEPFFVGWHWCAFIQNRYRGQGLKDTFDEPFDECVSQMQDFNRNIYKHVCLDT